MVEWYIISIVIAIIIGSVSVWAFIWGRRAFGKSEKVERLEQEVTEARKKAEAAAKARENQALRTVAFEVKNVEAYARGQAQLAAAMKKQQRGEPGWTIAFAPRERRSWGSISVLLDNVPVGEVPAQHTELFQRILYRSLQVQPAFYTREGAVRLLLTVTYPITPGELAVEEVERKLGE